MLLWQRSIGTSANVGYLNGQHVTWPSCDLTVALFSLLVVRFVSEEFEADVIGASSGPHERASCECSAASIWGA